MRSSSRFSSPSSRTRATADRRSRTGSSASRSSPDDAVPWPARRLPYPPMLQALRSRRFALATLAAFLLAQPVGSLRRALPVRAAPRGGALDAQHESRQPGPRHQHLSHHQRRCRPAGSAPGPLAHGADTRGGPRRGSHALGRAGPDPPRCSPPHLPHGRATTSRASSNPGNSSRPPRPTASSSAPRVRTGAAAHGPQTREQTTCRDSCDPAASRSSSSASPASLPGPPPRASPISPSISTPRATSSPSRERTSTRSRSPASAWAGTPMTARPTTTPSPPGKWRSRSSGS